ncbi:methyl-accepting chemotaxis protein [Bacillus sp. 31A1R]|uniref:Methyl-accepting chemotaxis protein n=1 Tax=Robertmurraya mangrovi TaxID=3098077 RepID=A0ABU5J4A9_9BACI|nr:methyl-accepting chemotaxis protein [Bacillus sp. 31A1R]MDZ5474187.1 methyl-accepting chemotaxis protein [Bacillus sp. 31A1R]
MSLSQRALIPIIIILLLVELTLGITGFTSQKNQLETIMNQQATSNINTLEQKLTENANTLTLLSDSLKMNYLRIANSIAISLAENPKLNKTENLMKLATKIGVDEIHLVDQDGILTHSNMSQFIGFDFNSSEQTKPFLTIGEEGLAQEPTQRGSDNKYFMYVGVKRVDQPGIIQIGMEPTSYIKTIESFDVHSLTKQVTVEGKGYLTLLKGDEVISSSMEDLQGKKVNELGDLQKFLTKDHNAIVNIGSNELLVISKMIGDYRIISVSYVSDYLQPLQKYITILITISVISLIAAVVIIWFFMNRSIVKPLNKLQSSILKVTNGELTFDQTLDIKRKDTIGVVTRGFIELVNSLRNMVQQVNESSYLVASSAEQLTASVEQSSTSAETVALMATKSAEATSTQRNGINLISNSVSEMNNGLKTVAINSDNMAKHAKHTNEQTSLGELKINSIVEAMNEISIFTDNTSQQIQSLVEKSKEIGNITSLITEIADQTNLLALNAAIEAARAGEHGKGFAVVAEEVRKLAEQSRNSVNTIDTIVKEIQDQTQVSLISMNKGNETVRSGLNFSAEVKQAFHVIEGSICDVSMSIEEVVQSIEHITKLSSTVSEAVDSIFEETEQSATASHESAAASEEQLATMEEITASAQNLSALAVLLQLNLDLTELMKSDFISG